MQGDTGGLFPEGDDFRVEWFTSGNRMAEFWKLIEAEILAHDQTQRGGRHAPGADRIFFQGPQSFDGIKFPSRVGNKGFEGTEEKANFDALTTQIVASSPDVVYFGGMYSQAAILFKQAREKGYEGMFLSDDGFDSTDAAKIGGETLITGAGTYYSTVSGPAAVYPGTAKFIADFKAKYSSEPQPFAAQGYDAMAICLKAIEDAAVANGGKLPERAAVTAAIRALKDFAGITGTFTFNSIGDPVTAQYFIIKVDSANPDDWSKNSIAQTLDIAPPAP
jgi:branched-chain amino acid transport system substrate-binding protein